MADILTRDNELTYVSFPITKTEVTADGDLVVYGKATDGSIDSDQQIVDPDWSAKALRQWLDTGGNVRVQHNAQRDPAGKGLAVEVTADGHYVKSLIVEPVAKELVAKGVLRAYSVGISRPVIEPDVAGKALGGVIRGGPQTEICEISLVDRPANKNCAFQLVKADKDGAPELVGKVLGDAAGLLTKAASKVSAAAAGTDVTVTLPGDVQVRFTPADMARAVSKSAAAGTTDKRQADQAAGGGADRDRIPAADSADQDRSFPVVTPGDVQDAASKGAAPADDPADDDGEADGGQGGGDQPDGGKKLPPWLKPGKKGKKAKKAADGQPTAASDPQVVKGDDPACAGCGRGMDDGDRFCAGCGKKAGAAGKAADADAGKSKPTPADGAVGEHHTDPVPAHREPDGQAVEALEHDAGMPTTPDAQVKAAVRLKSLGVPPDLGVLHDLTCPAFHPDDAAKCHPGADLSALDVAAWQAKALDAAAAAPLAVAQTATRLWQHATTIKGTDAYTLAELRWEAHKAFQDANPGPGSAPTPTQVTAGRFRRPLITDGHEAQSPGHAAPNTAAVPDGGGISATDYRRGPLTGGHAADSPANKADAADLVTVPAATGVPTRTYYSNVGRNNARQAMAAMHDHIAQTFPDLCPMAGGDEQRVLSRPVPTPGATPSVAAVKADVSTGDADRVARKSDKARRRELVGKVLEGQISVNQARAELGLPALAIEPAAVEPAAVEKAAVPAAPAVDLAAVVKTAVAEATAVLHDQLSQQQTLIDRLAAQPDTTSAPYRGAASLPQQPTSSPAGVDTVAKSAERAQAMLAAEMERQWRTSPDPTTREAAWESLLRMRGIPHHS